VAAAEALGMTMRSRVAALLAAAAVFMGLVFLPSGTTAERDPRWNFVVILTDDQTLDSIPHDPPVMPYLQSRSGDPNDHWIVFRNGFVNTPLCCPSRATLLTGLYAHDHGVLDNDLGSRLDESTTIADALHTAGYYTGLVGKYLNQYPFGRAPYVPRGWDSWVGKQQGPVTDLYYDYTLIEQGVPVRYGSAEDDYATDVFADKAVDFIRTAPLEDPFFLWFAPTAPHPPWVVAPRHEGTYTDMPLEPPESVGEADVSDKPAWVQALPPLGPSARAGLREAHRRSFETLVAVDEAVHRIMDALEHRGDLDHTVVVFLSDNGYSFGEHRWERKTCPYDECTRVPFLVRYPMADRRVERTVVSAADIAPTIAEIAGVSLPNPVDGVSLAPLIEHDDRSGLPNAAYSEWVGDREIPEWWQIRTDEFSYIEYITGERELYDLTTDPLELTNVIDDPAYGSTVARLEAALELDRQT
jgi:N-acetylglucosamine-6-sulfatase